MKARAPAALLAAIALQACSGAAEERAPAQNEVGISLDDANRDANAPAIVDLFKRTCLDAGGSEGALGGALAGSGWRHEQVQSATGALPISAWRLDRGELVQAAMSVGAGNNFIDCELRLDNEVAPSLERMRDALRPLLRYPRLREVSAGPPEARWQWATGDRAERVLTVGPARQEPGRGARMSLHLRITETVLVEGAPRPPQANETESDAANVQ